MCLSDRTHCLSRYCDHRSAENDEQAAIEETRTLHIAFDDEISFRRSLTAAIFAIDDQALSKGKAALVALGIQEQKNVKYTRLQLFRAMRPPTRERLAAVQKTLKGAGRDQVSEEQMSPYHVENPKTFPLAK